MKAAFIGIKHVSGTSQKTGRDFAFDVACITSPMDARDAECGAKGLDVHMSTIPDRWKEILSDANVGKEIDVEFYYANGRENIGYCALLPTK